MAATPPITVDHRHDVTFQVADEARVPQHLTHSLTHPLTHSLSLRQDGLGLNQ